MNYQNFIASLKGLKTDNADAVKAARFVSLGSGTPFDLIDTCTESPSVKNYYRQTLIHGNADVLAKFERYRQRHPMQADVRSVSFDYDVCGDYVDVGRFMGGEPECMVDFSHSAETRFVDFYVNIDVCCNVGEENSFAYYAAAISVIDSLENSGYRVRLTGVNYSDDIINGKVYEVTCVIKEYSEPINYAYLTSICMAQTPFFTAVMYRPDRNLYQYAGCDYLPGFEPNVTMNENTFYAPSLFGKNRHGQVYSNLSHKPDAFTFDNLIQDWKLAHLLKK